MKPPFTTPPAALAAAMLLAAAGCAGAPAYRLYPGRVHKDVVVCNVQLAEALDAGAYSRIAEDELIGLKENVLLGHLIPAGTGFRVHQDLRVKYLVEPEDYDMQDEQRMLAEAAHAAEALGADPHATLGVPQVEVKDVDIVLGESADAGHDN